VLWLILFQQVYPSTIIQQLLTLLQRNGLNSIFILALCSLLWSYLLARISGYRPWWKIGFATVAGIFAGWFSPLSNLDAWLSEGTPIHVVYAVAMCGLVGTVTFCVGLAYGFVLRSLKAALRIAFTTSLVSVVAMLLTITLFEQMGLRVGTGNFAMSKVTVASLLASAVLGGMVLGVEFSRFVRARNDQRSAFP
jgi:hypothetical protein